MREPVSCQRSQSSSTRLLHSGMAIGVQVWFLSTVSGGAMSPVPPFATLMIILALRCRPLGVDRMKGQTRTSIYSGSRQIVTAKRHSTCIILELQWQMPRLWNLSWTNGWLHILEVNTRWWLPMVALNKTVKEVRPGLLSWLSDEVVSVVLWK